MYKSGKKGNPLKIDEGLDIIHQTLEKGNAIIVGVDYTSNQRHNKETDNTPRCLKVAPKQKTKSLFLVFSFCLTINQM
jgi:hypothetical protein